MINLNNHKKRNLKKIFPFGLIWAFYAIIYSIVERGLLGGISIYPATGNDYNFLISLVTTFCLSLIMGWIMGYIEVIYLKNYFNKYSFTTKIVIKSILYFLSVIIFLLVVSTISNAIIQQGNPFSAIGVASLKKFVFNFAFWSIVIYAGSIILITVFLAEISDHLGQGILMNFIFGKYHKPNEEERIFMFLDMNASTMIAEKLGNIKYFQLLKEYFSDMSEAIVQTNGDVYQYVGDEIVISWKMKEGLDQANCIKCFYMIKDIMKENKLKYLTQFEFFPTFKAGIHMGNVASGKIGKLKQDILYTGDVLNATARIQGYCSVLNTELLISKVLKDEVDKYGQFTYADVGFQSLRGRMRGMQIFNCTRENIK